MPQRPLTAQEALEQEGFIPHASYGDYSPGTIVYNRDPHSAVPLDTPLVVMGPLSVTEVMAFVNRVGWLPIDYPNDAKFYKVIAE